MKKNNFFIAFFCALFLLLFFWPSFSVFKNWSSWQSEAFPTSRIFWVSLLQALLSTAGSLFFGFLGAWGLCVLRPRWPASLFLFLEYLIVLPSFLPPLIVIVGVLSCLPFFPFGLEGVVLMHLFFEVGIVAVVLGRWMSQALATYGDLFLLHDRSLISQWRGLLPLFKRDLFMLSGFLFVFFMTSLSIPMILSGGGLITLEQGLYSALKNSQPWNQILPFYFVQLLCVLPFFIFAPRAVSSRSESATNSSLRLRKGVGLVSVGVLPVVCVLIGLLWQWPRGLKAALREDLMYSQTVVGSLLIGFLTAGLSYLLLCLMSLFYQQKNLRFAIRALTIPSSVVFGIFFLKIPSQTAIPPLVVLTFLLALLSLPTLVKMGVCQQIENLDEQIEIAQSLGASSWKIFSRVVFPQVHPWVAFLSGLSGVWGLGDFAFTRLFLSEDLTVGLKIQSLMEQYRWDQAVFLSWTLLLVGLVVFVFFGGLAYVASEKLK